MRRAGLPEGYAAALETGIWPSLDILPAAEKYFTGMALEARQIAEPPPCVALDRLETLWVNTGTLCNLACTRCFMESSPANESLSYFPLAEFTALLADAPPTLGEIGFTGGEPFMNPDIMPMLEAALAAGKRILVLTNAMRPMQRHATALARLLERYPGQVGIRVSLDHYLPDRHEALRGDNSFGPTFSGLKFLAESGARLSVASRTPWGETEAMMQAGFTRWFTQHGLPDIPLVLFPEMDAFAPAPSVSARAVAELPAEEPLMCRTSRMVVKRKGEAGFSITPCTLLPNRPLASWDEPVRLDHPHCAQFCVYGGASCAGAPG
jgi:pyruvate-formate lyase-activating enzyme